MRALKTCRGRSGRFPLILKLGLMVINHPAVYLEEMRDLGFYCTLSKGVNEYLLRN
jgi:hypothetical protein